MKRLVYAPKIEAWVKADSGLYNLTEFITDFSIDRKVNSVSSAELTLRNPNKVWTNSVYKDAITGETKIGPILHPMDPITIFLTRLQGKPVQVFTGFCDSTPYLQLFPGTVSLTASCTLKKLLYTYFDSGLPFMREYLESYGWSPTGNGSIVHPEAEANAVNTEGETQKTAKGTNVQYGDSGIGELLYHVLRDIGGWPDDTIFIQEMPASVIELVSNLFDLFRAQGEESAAELKSLLHEIIGSASLGSGGTNGGEEPNAQGEPNGEEFKGKVSWFNESENPGQGTAGGKTTSEPGIALNLHPGTDSGWNNDRTNGWIEQCRNGNPVYARVTIQGKSANLPITDLGPSGFTGRCIDVTEGGVKKLGFTTSNFPTDAVGTAVILGSPSGESKHHPKSFE